MRKPRIAVDADNVLLDYSTAYAWAWKRAFGWHPIERDPTAYWPMDRWGVERLTGEPLDRFRACFDTQFWSTIPAVPGAIQGCNDLHEAGFELVCVSALEPQHEAARLKNLRALGFPIERVVATGADASVANPKAAALAELDPVAFVDDFLPYLRGLRSSIHTALVVRQRTGTPNAGPDVECVGSQHDDLCAFSAWWLARSPSTQLGLDPSRS
jgi:hypothetical protein